MHSKIIETLSLSSNKKELNSIFSLGTGLLRPQSPRKVRSWSRRLSMKIFTSFQWCCSVLFSIATCWSSSARSPRLLPNYFIFLPRIRSCWFIPKITLIIRWFDRARNGISSRHSSSKIFQQWPVSSFACAALVFLFWWRVGKWRRLAGSSIPRSYQFLCFWLLSISLAW